MRVRICRCDECADGGELLEYLALAGLSEDELGRLRGRGHTQARIAGAAARLALLHALTDESDGVIVCPSQRPVFKDKPLDGLTRAESGAPRMAEGGPFVSLAHSDRLAVAAVSRCGRIGVDVEPLDRRIAHAERVAARYFSEGERALLAAAPDGARAFVGIWTRKEALGKALGTGLNNQVELLDTTAYPPDCFSAWEIEGELVSVCCLPREGERE